MLLVKAQCDAASSCSPFFFLFPLPFAFFTLCLILPTFFSPSPGGVRCSSNDVIQTSRCGASLCIHMYVWVRTPLQRNPCESGPVALVCATWSRAKHVAVFVAFDGWVWCLSCLAARTKLHRIIPYPCYAFGSGGLVGPLLFSLSNRVGV